jgi:hypothetical protein
LFAGEVRPNPPPPPPGFELNILLLPLCLVIANVILLGLVFIVVSL